MRSVVLLVAIALPCALALTCYQGTEVDKYQKSACPTNTSVCCTEKTGDKLTKSCHESAERNNDPKCCATDLCNKDDGESTDSQSNAAGFHTHFAVGLIAYALFSMS